MRAYTQTPPPGRSAPAPTVVHLSGVGFKVFSHAGRTALHVGYSHYVVVRTPREAQVRSRRAALVVHPVTPTGVGDLAHRVCRVKRPDPYKGRGIYPTGGRPTLKPGKRR